MLFVEKVYGFYPDTFSSFGVNRQQGCDVKDLWLEEAYRERVLES